jgi:hypothetical protein
MSAPLPTLKAEFVRELDRFLQEKQMPYITSIERLARCDGLLLGIEEILQLRFGEEGLKLMPELREMNDHEKLEQILKAIRTAPNLDAVRRLWAPGTP